MPSKKTDKNTRKDPKKYTFVERRTELIKTIVQVGHPKAISQTALSKHYGVSQSQISQDLKKISDEIKDDLIFSAELIMHTVFNKAILKGIQSTSFKENAEAARLAKMWMEYMMDVGIKNRTMMRHEVVTKQPPVSEEESKKKWDKLLNELKEEDEARKNYGKNKS